MKKSPADKKPRKPGPGRRPLPDAEKKVRKVLFLLPDTCAALEKSENSGISGENLLRKALFSNA